MKRKLVPCQLLAWRILQIPSINPWLLCIQFSRPPAADLEPPQLLLLDLLQPHTADMPRDSILIPISHPCAIPDETDVEDVFFETTASEHHDAQSLAAACCNWFVRSHTVEPEHNLASGMSGIAPARRRKKKLGLQPTHLNSHRCGGFIAFPDLAATKSHQLRL